ncbi:platelet glycoprotein Ib alpha chain-like [Acanthaster planci]|uniref:Platelet glycoprotein Ib alpha chain-like n=1 Tax=Acanthaster planci TaxID=133434 RepID=A0A8B7YZJ5_ACAPL|nr:platelet glycoprotein Ib alpha chain-like [Acanthaster planci]
MSLGQCIARLLEQWDALPYFQHQLVFESQQKKKGLQETAPKKGKSSSLTKPPHTSSLSMPPSGSSLVWPPPTSSPTKPPSTSSLTKPPSTSSLTKPPSTSSLTKPPSTSSLTKPPSTSSLTKPPSTSSLTKPPSTSSLTKPPSTSSLAKPPSTSRSAKPSFTASTKPSTHGTAKLPTPSSNPERIVKVMMDPNTKLSCYFLMRAIPVVDKSNTFLQKDEPCIYLLHSVISQQFTDLVIIFIWPQCITAAEVTNDIDYGKRSNQKSDEDPYIGVCAQAYLQKQGHLCNLEQFYSCVRRYYAKACEYMLQAFLFGDKVLVNAENLGHNKKT